MSTQNVTTKAYEEKISAQLQQAKAQLGEFEARAKGKAAQAEIDTINRLKTKHEEIDKKRQDLRTVGEAKVDQAKAEIDAEVAKLKTSLAGLATKLKVEPHTKAS
jgi:F0F1-type ATP synthase membrane subunit b/b'